MNQQQQTYDSSIKAILNEDAPAILPLLLPGVEVIEVLDIEILRPPIRADRVYRVLYRGRPHTFHLEFQASRDDKNDTMLLQAIDELIEYSKGDESKLERRLLWLSTFLRRAEVMPPLEKQRVLERLKMFDELLEQDEFVQRQHERGLQEGAINEDKEVLVNYISIRYPNLTELARQRAEKTTQKVVLRNILSMIFAAPDEATVRFILTAPSPAA